MKKILPVSIIALLFFVVQCNRTPVQPDHSEVLGIQSLVWTQFASENSALYLQGYNVATDRLAEELTGKHEMPVAVVLDIDETVLDNSPYNVDLVRKGNGYSDETWNRWCKREEATPLPGALEFTTFAADRGVEVFYVSNRLAETLDATISNLQKYNFPFADSAHVLLKTTTSSKDERRAAIASEHRIVLLLGDNLGDFDGIFDSRGKGMGKASVKRYRDEFGRRFIVFPNAMYGSWEREAFPQGIPSADTALRAMRGIGD